MPTTEIVDPQQIDLLSRYLNPESETFGDLKNSAIQAKYSESYANALSGLMPKWLYDSISQSNLVQKAEKNLKEFLEMDTNNIMNKDGKLVEQTDVGLVRVKADISKFVVSKGSKGKWSETQKTESVNKNLNLNLNADVKQEAYDDIVREAEDKYLKLLDE